MAEESVADQLRKRGVKDRNVLVRMAERGQLLALKCEMPQCYCFRGRRYFEPISPGADWMPTADHYPRLKMHGGRLTPDNVRLGHRLCNQRDYIWRVKINAMLGKWMSLEEIAEELNVEKVPTIHGTNRWTADIGAQGIRFLVRVRRWVPLCATTALNRLAQGLFSGPLGTDPAGACQLLISAEPGTALGPSLRLKGRSTKPQP